MSNLVLYAVTVLIWGSTWLAIKYQLGTVSAAVSVVWRFGFAAVVLFAVARHRRLPIAVRSMAPSTHAWLAAQGLFLFGINYVAVYLAERTLPSGIVAVLFSFAVFFNLIGARLWFRTPIPPAAALGSLIGCLGVVLVFSGPLEELHGSAGALIGTGYALLSAVLASVGNLVAARSYREGVRVIPGTAWSMLYGAIAVALYAAARGEHFVLEPTPRYLVSLLYLTLCGSVIAFTAYLTLVKRIGPGRAGYTSVAIPVVALGLSTVQEDLHWRPLMVVGVLLCVAGNVLVLQGPGRLARSLKAAWQALR